MFKTVVPVTAERHRDKKIVPLDSFAFAGQSHVASIMAHEFRPAAATYAIVFVENKDLDEFRPVVLLGLEPGRNLFVDAAGAWRAPYIPAIVRRYPFTLANTDDALVFTICVDEESGLLSDSEGQALFTEDGQPAEPLEHVKRYLGELHQMESLTGEFCAHLKQLNMFAPLNLQLHDDGGVRTITGVYAVNEERLNSLSDQRFLELRTKGYLDLIYRHLTSLGQVERLGQLRNERAAGGENGSGSAQ
ncbi:SapC family protein [Azospirillum sp. sgz302134]